jgi:tetratricopeptide (TPR) repeat protein
MNEDMNEEGPGGPPTQLADSRPQLDCPLRVTIPVNAPARIARSSQDDHIQKNAFSPIALSQTKSSLPTLLGLTKPQEESKKSGPSAKDIAGGNKEKGDAGIATAIADFSTLAFSSKRSGKKDKEAIAYVSLGVIYDNQGNQLKAIENYQLYADLCEEMGDSAGAACAYNCLGVDFMLLACPPSDTGFVGDGTVIRTSEQIEYLDKACICHKKHLDIGPDQGGRFVANTNLGISLGMRNDVGPAAKYHQDALRIAIKMQTLYGQSIAVGNLGMLALTKKDLTTARTCFEQHLQLVQALLDPEAEINAWKLLAKLCGREENYEDAMENLSQASKIAVSNRLLNELRRINCLLGVAQGHLHFREYSQQLLSSMSSS